MLAELGRFTGTEKYHRTHPGVLLTDGAKYLADEGGCYWWMDIIWSYQNKLKKHDFQHWKLELTPKGGCTITCDDGNENVLVKQEVPLTDFKFNYEVYACRDGNELIIMLKSEY